ncbi:sugar transferase [Cellulomonas sp. S1-8]|uniref:sugar transferase n=1 Tax=Cellulomonas sp. S1-8 TaxID=2904790 RepID=UPI002244A9E7|nr:sugar transferase [Cellulomonas sp. S1-8]UZN04145.1 sugar transferase [Cellulomonas sp. S1-8]
MMARHSTGGRRGARAAKRALDLAVAVPVVIVTAPVQLATALAVRVALGRPVLFRQQRPGLHGRPFTMVKFRTMLLPEQVDGTTDDAVRLTPVGRVLRAASLDELPTLLSVIAGDMSLVGPRPLLMEYLERYTPTQARRHEVRPGLTGLAQVSGRNDQAWDDRLRLDVEYVDTWSFTGDVRILIRTLGSVLRREGISATGHATMPLFTGATEPSTLRAT